jgi:hypothetical protein
MISPLWILLAVGVLAIVGMAVGIKLNHKNDPDTDIR